MSKNISMISIAMAIIILIRCIFDSNEKIIYIVAGINIIAIAFVIYTIIDKVEKGIITKIKATRTPEELITRQIKNIHKIIWMSSLIGSFLVFALYLKFLCSGLGNDILSILALGISILDDEIVKNVTDYY